MMPHEGNVPEHKVHTKKHIARLEKEKKQRKILLIGIISLLGIIVVVLFVLPLITNLLRPTRTVARVNSDKISVAQYQNRVRFERLTLERTFLNYQLSSFAPYFQSQLLEVQNQLDDYLTFGNTILQNMIYEALISQDAEARGITVTEEEIDKAIEEYFGFFAQGTPTPRPTVEYKPTSTLSAAQLALITATPLPTATSSVPTALPTVTNTPGVTATATATEVLVTSTPTVEPTATPIPPTPTAYTVEGFEMLHATVQADWEAQIKFADADFREYIRNSLYNQKLYALVTEDISQEQEMLWIRHILVTSEEQALEIKGQIDAGGDFGELAKINSLDTANSMQGGDLGWVYQGQMVEEFENAAWEMTVGEISQPVQSSFGYHIIQVLGREVRQLSSDQFTESKGKIYQKYYEGLSEGADIEISDIWATVVPSEPSIPAEYRIQTQ